MRFSSFRLLELVVLLGLGPGCDWVVAGDGLAPAPARVPVVYSSDLFHPHQDPDDHFDLACLYAMPEADLRAIILDQGQEQAKRPGFPAVRQMNHLTGRSVPAAIGLRDKLVSPEDKDLDQPAEFQGGVRLLLKTLRESETKVAILFVGSARDVVAALNREPGLFKEKVRCVQGFIGEASDPGNQEWNVSLDPQAYIGLVRADIPFHWVPCFDGGLWKNNGHASFWKIKHGQVLAHAPEPLQRFFLYMLRQETNDPIACLSEPLSAKDREWLMGGERNLWCTAFLGLAVGRPVRADGASQDVAGFERVDVTVDEQAVVRYGKGAGSHSVMRFVIKDRERFADVATRATADLLASFPLSVRRP